MISDEYFANIAQKLLEDTESFTLSLLEDVKKAAQRLIGNPDAPIDLQREEQKATQQWQTYNEQARQWIDQNLPKAYKKGITTANGDAGEGTTLTAGAFSAIPLLGPSAFQGQISEAAREVLKDLPEHHTMYGVFQQSAYEDFANTRIPVVRSYSDKVRRLVVEASDQAYREADTLTRRELTQSIMRDLADEGITGIRYQNGRTVMLDSYAEMVARTQTGNASRQAHMNRLQEYGRDLIVISQHWPVSNLCEPWQGRVYSISGTSENYPPLDRALSGGLYHPNCKHSQSGYTPGQPIPDARDQMDAEENERKYELDQKQRYNERQIRAWKRRKATALTDDELQKANRKIRQWQERQRELIDNNDFLRRKYNRESITATGRNIPT